MKDTDDPLQAISFPPIIGATVKTYALCKMVTTTLVVFACAAIPTIASILLLALTVKKDTKAITKVPMIILGTVLLCAFIVFQAHWTIDGISNQTVIPSREVIRKSFMHTTFFFMTTWEFFFTTSPLWIFVFIVLVLWNKFQPTVQS